MLGFRGHFLTKSRALLDHLHAPSAPNAATWRLRDDLDQLAADTDNHGDDGPVDLDTITVINDWRVVQHRPPQPRRTRTRAWPSPNATAHNDAHPNREEGGMNFWTGVRDQRLGSSRRPSQARRGGDEMKDNGCVLTSHAHGSVLLEHFAGV